MMAGPIDFIVRRPIYDSAMATVGYDLVFESAADGGAAARLIVEGSAGFELPDLLRDSLGLVSVPAELICSPELSPLPGIGFDVQPAVTVDEGVASGIRRCAALRIPVVVHDCHRPGIEEGRYPH